MKAIILFALLASVNAFAAEPTAPASSSNCAAATDNRLTNGNPSDAHRQLAMIEGQSTAAPKTTQKGSGASH